jgi:hypothetical protein
MPRTWGQGSSLLSTHFLQTLAIASLSPLTYWSLIARPSPWSLYTKPSLRSLLRGSLRHGAFFAEPPSWSLHHKALIQNNHRAFIRGLRSRPSSKSFILDLRPRPSLEPSSGDLLWLGLRRGPSLARPSSGDLLPPGLRHGPSPANLLREIFSRWPSLGDLLQLAFTKKPSALNPFRDAFPKILQHSGFILIFYGKKH